MQNVPLEKKSTAMGYFQAIYAIGMTFIPIFTGMIAGFRDITTGFFFLSFLAMLGVFGALWLYRKENGPKVREQC